MNSQGKCWPGAELAAQAEDLNYPSRRLRLRDARRLDTRRVSIGALRKTPLALKAELDRSPTVPVY